MEEKKTLSKYLYDEIAGQIKSGNLSYGDRLPSNRTLCEEYNVGIRTVRDVMKKLAEDGYVKAVARSHVEVSYKRPEDADGIWVKSILERRGALIDLQETMAYLFPDICAEASRLIDNNLVEKYREEIRDAAGGTVKEQWNAFATLLLRVVSIFRNSLLKDLYTDAALYARMSLNKSDLKEYLEPGDGSGNVLNEFLDLVKSRDVKGVNQVVAGMFQKSIGVFSAYYNDLLKEYPNFDAEQTDFEWNAEKGRVYRYTSIARDVIKAIWDGTYPPGTYIPGNYILRKEYGVAETTVKRAMDNLILLGLAQKDEQHRKYVVSVNKEKSRELIIEGGALKEEILTLLEAFHTTALICGGIADAGFDYLGEDAARQLEEEISDPGILTPPICVLDQLVRAQPLKPLKTMFFQLRQILDWGYYFKFLHQKESDLEMIEAKTKIAIGCIRDGDKNALKVMLQDVFRLEFELLRQALIGFGVPESANLRLS